MKTTQLRYNSTIEGLLVLTVTNCRLITASYEHEKAKTLDNGQKNAL